MEFALDDAQEDFRRSMRGFFEAKLPHESLPALIDDLDGEEPSLWHEMAEQLGLQGMTVPEELGGGGHGPIELAIVMEETGYALLPGSFFATVALAVPTLLESADADAQQRHLPQIAAGELTATVAFDTNVRADAKYVLTGTAERVCNGADVGLVIVSADGPAGPSLYLVEADSPGFERVAAEPFDVGRRIADLHFDGALAQPLGAPGDAHAVLERALETATIALAAEQVGGAQRCLDIAVAYAKERTAFGRQIGSFQAIKHRCADMLAMVDAARTAAWFAAWTCSEQLDERATAVPVAKLCAAEAYVAAARGSIQTLGGIGFTWEHPAHLHFRKALATQHFHGSSQEARATLAAQLLGESA